MSKLIRCLLIVMFMAVPLFGACQSKSGLKLSFEGASEKAMEIKSGFIYASTKTFSAPDGKGGFTHGKAASYTFYVATYPLDTKRGSISLGKATTADGQMRVSFSLVGAEGTTAGGKEASPVAKGDYSAKAEKFMKVESIQIAVHSGGKEVKHRLNEKKTEGSVKITSVEGDKVTGEIEVKEGKNAIKGGFTAQLWKRK